MIFLPLDVFRFHLLPPPPKAVSWAGGAVYLAGWAVMFTAIFQNRFAAPVVQDQTEQGQTVIDTGLYAVVRHPLYSGVLLLCSGMALWLESLAGLVGVLVLLMILGVRIAIEEADLRRTLPGYADYARRVRFRLIPFVI
jgi:protein-S-isoprenylcysteine O-methyltransferase Ste14